MDNTLLWQHFTQQGEIRSNIINDATGIYAVADYGRGNTPDTKTSSTLFSLDHQGQLRWSQVIAGSGRTSGGLTEVIFYQEYVIAIGDALYVCLKSDGSIIYQSDTLQNLSGYRPYVRATLNQDVLCFIIGTTLYEFDLLSHTLSSVNLRDIITSLSNIPILAKIAFDGSGNYYIGGPQYFISLSPSKQVRWLFNSGNDAISFRATPWIDEDRQQLYIGTKANELSEFLCLDLTTGQLKWSSPIHSDLYSSPLLYQDRIYVASEARKVHVLNPNGQLVYEVDIEEDVTWPSCVIDSQGRLYIAGMRGFVYAIKTTP